MAQPDDPYAIYLEQVMKLMKERGLDKNEIGQWGKLTVTEDNSRGISVSIETPNIWITADIMKSDWSLAGPAAAFGGFVGAAYYNYGSSGNFVGES